MKKLTVWLSLFTSTGTLLCCALPSLLVALGMGATMAGLVTAVPQLIWLSQYKLTVFATSGTMIAVAGLLQYRARFDACPIDVDQAKACETSRKWSIYIWMASLVTWLTGATFAFVLSA